MFKRVPTSKAGLSKIAPLDVFWAIAAPILALALRDPNLLDIGDATEGIPPGYQYILVTIICAIPAFLVFRISEGMNHLFSVHDAFAVCAAVAATVASSSLFLFVLTRLDGVPRSTPLICGLVLGAGLIVDRAIARVYHQKLITHKAKHEATAAPQDLRRIILIGADRFSALTAKLLEHQRPRTTQAVAAIDPREALIGRAIAGVKIVGSVEDFEAIVDEFAVHGVEIDEVWLSDDVTSLSDDTIERVSEQCATRGLKFARISEALNLTPSIICASDNWRSDADDATRLGGYFKLKRVIDFIGASALLLALMPLTLIAAYLVLVDVGAPMIFWQQRIGQNGRRFLVYKFRTYRAPYDRGGRKIPEEQRLSKIGRAIRAARLDEIPQLLNVLIGDMSLIGPRPLLPHDQPSDPRLRLLTRPGITGWAQLNGGTIVTPEEKDALDIWYIHHASLWLDLRIVVSTLLFAFKGEKVDDLALKQAMRWREEHMAARNLVEGERQLAAETVGEGPVSLLKDRAVQI
ncbi:sugar transferase [Methylocystis sp.]|uniref:sugar transferase n=1 Tax=Methylocystis sp. TaxID=1911079 RepID=UPI003D112956